MHRVLEAKHTSFWCATQTHCVSDEGGKDEEDNSSKGCLSVIGDFGMIGTLK